MKSIFFTRILPFLLPVLILGSIRFSALPELCENSTDVYWHIHAAERSLQEMTAKTYPITLSIWRDHFADKEFLFHVLLKSYTGIKTLFHSPLTPPFTGASILLLMIFFFCFVQTAVKAGIKGKMLILFSLSVALFTPLFSYRLLMIRPHVFSMALMMISYSVLLNGPHKRSTVFLIFGMGWLFAWSYSTPHLLTVAAAGFGIAWFPRERFRSLLPVPAAVLGILCGLLIHPQSPNTFLLWKIQGIDALLNPSAGLGGGMIPFAKELTLPSTLWFTVLIPVSVLIYCTVLMWNRLREQKGLKGIPPHCTAFTLLTVLWTAAVCMISIRPIEYLVPTLFLAFGSLLPEILAEDSFFFCRMPKRTLGVICSYLILFILANSIYTAYTLRTQTKPAPVQLAAALKQLASPGDRVINLDWSDFPPMEFLAPEFEYTWGLDPMFSFTPFPEKSRLLGRLSRHGIHNSARIRRVFQAEYAILLNKKRFMGKNLQENCGWETVYDGPDGWIFRLAAH